ncbi:hypothetical protein PMAYCL1PPCAC_27743, partial [Pristionchus mayeri]
MIAFSPGISKPGEERPFKSVISMSANGFLLDAEETVSTSHTFAKELGCEGSAQEIMDCLRGFDTKSIIKAASKLLGPRGPNGITMAGELFPISNQEELRERKDPVRLMIGTTIYELGGGHMNADVVFRVLGIANKEECWEKYLEDLKSGQFDPQYDEPSQEIIVASQVYARYIAEIGGESYIYKYENTVHGFHTQDAHLVLGMHEWEKDENELWLSRAYPRYFANFINGKPPASNWSRYNPQLMNYYSVNRSRSDNVFPHMEYGYYKELIQYYENLVEYDKNLSIAKKQTMDAPVQYKSLNATGNVQDFLESLSVVEIVVFFIIAVIIFYVVCCLCNCYTWFCCCCGCRKNQG